MVNVALETTAMKVWDGSWSRDNKWCQQHYIEPDGWLDSYNLYSDSTTFPYCCLLWLEFAHFLVRFCVQNNTLANLLVSSAELLLPTAGIHVKRTSYLKAKERTLSTTATNGPLCIVSINIRDHGKWKRENMLCLSIEEHLLLFLNEATRAAKDNNVSRTILTPPTLSSP